MALDPTHRRTIADAIRAGHGTRSAASIAREHRVATGTVINIAREIGQPDAFTRAVMKSATEARTADMRDQRTRTAERMLAKANEFLSALDGPFLVHAFGGRDNTYAEHLLDGPPTGDIRNLITAAAIAVDKHLVLERHDSGDAADGARGLVAGLLDAIRGDVAASDEQRRGD